MKTAKPLTNARARAAQGVHATPRASQSAAARQPAPSRAQTPPAPPVYRPQPTPKVLQRKTAAHSPRVEPACAAKSPAAPPAYRPQPAPSVLQRKTAAASTQPAQPARVHLPPRAVHVPRTPAATPTAPTPSRGGVARNVLQRMEWHGGMDRYDPPPYAPLNLPANSEKTPLIKNKVKQQMVDDIVGQEPPKQTNRMVKGTKYAVLTGAQDVRGQVRITCNNQELESAALTPTQDAEPPYTTGPRHVHGEDFARLYFSRNDGEARILPQAERILFHAIDQVAWDGRDEPEHHHMLTLVGPFGPCEGCRMRMELFRQRWINKAKERDTCRKLRLTLSYIYYYSAGTTGERGFTEKDLEDRDVKDRYLSGMNASPKDKYKFNYAVKDPRWTKYEYEHKKSLPVNWYKATAQNY